MGEVFKKSRREEVFSEVQGACPPKYVFPRTSNKNHAGDNVRQDNVTNVGEQMTHLVRNHVKHIGRSEKRSKKMNVIGERKKNPALLEKCHALGLPKPSASQQRNGALARVN